MSTIALHLPNETIEKLRARAEKAGTTAEAILEELATNIADEENYTLHGRPRFISQPRLTDEEFRKLLDEIAAGPSGTPLPPDFSREDIYNDHD